MRRLEPFSHFWRARVVMAPPALAALVLAGCGPAEPPDDLDFPGLEASWSPSDLVAKDCIRVKVTERSLTEPLAPEIPVAGMRVLVTSDEYTHIGGSVFTGADGFAVVEVKPYTNVKLSLSHPAGYKVLDPFSLTATSTAPIVAKSYAGAGFSLCDAAAVAVTLCGNGVKQGTEQCDDGNSVDNDGCTNRCSSAKCGDGILQAGEQCDDGNLSNLDACTSSCKFAVCGDGYTQPGETCDDGNSNNNDTCTTLCKPPSCGDGIKQVAEQCDDGNTNNDDTCTTLCKSPSCGDGIKQAAEQCDDGNTSNTDACTNACKNAKCGDGFVQPGEACDDGNGNDADACSNTCKLPACGDGIVQVGEACDDGDLDNTDACTTLCQPPFCGDGFLQFGETCDDGNTNNNDACTTLCKPPACGDGIKQATEQCDDGNTNNDDTCTTLCKPPTCGDGIKQLTEQCDDGNANNEDTCTVLCKPPTCGDGIKQLTEQCDDGNANNDDTCTMLCKPPACGDGFVQPGEICDDGNTNNGDGCNNSCVSPGSALATGNYNGASSGQDQGFAIASDAAGNILVTGVESVVGQGLNIWLGKFTPKGGLLWSTNANGAASGNDYGYGVAVAPSGDPVVVGAEASSSTGLDIVIRKHSATSGGVLWKATHALPGDDIGYDVAVDASGFIAVVGSASGSPASFWIARYTATGTLSWMRNYAASSGFAIGKMSVSFDAAGNVIASGFETSLSGGADKIWVIKYAANGTLTSAMTFNATGYRPNAVTVDVNGDVIASGYVYVNGQDENVWIQKYTSQGASIWSSTWNGAANYWDRGNDVATDSGRNVLVTGYEYVVGEGINVWTRKFSPTGMVLWTNGYNGAANANDYGMGIAADGADNVLVTGYDAVTGQGSNVWLRKFAP
ncbi:DUF4215 domain-containing protein [Polyangium sp. 15x6]|uniref:DUF4215 domain-containing protein n=1 Tax=Polyangium sp. 15x6 TaxID=3042687 RepID=UPI00249BDCB5|nr:DUF4215 domain-containing protein [Polyangium sp. 15x6]MDI3287344.1 DUF4215 domain-containing protein [Polyangium sp. 15x6]